jgi:hypothetical protein
LSLLAKFEEVSFVTGLDGEYSAAAYEAHSSVIAADIVIFLIPESMIALQSCVCSLGARDAVGVRGHDTKDKQQRPKSVIGVKRCSSTIVAVRLAPYTC